MNLQEQATAAYRQREAEETARADQQRREEAERRANEGAGFLKKALAAIGIEAAPTCERVTVDGVTFVASTETSRQSDIPYSSSRPALRIETPHELPSPLNEEDSDHVVTSGEIKSLADVGEWLEVGALRAMRSREEYYRSEYDMPDPDPFD